MEAWLPAFPTAGEIADYAERHNLHGIPRSVIANRILDEQKPAKDPAGFIDADLYVAGLLALDAAARAVDLDRTVFLAAVPAAAAKIIQHCIVKDTP